jgi:GT2 family glycosyltransferase
LIIEITYSKTSSPKDLDTDSEDARVLSIAYHSMELLVRNKNFKVNLNSSVSNKIFGFYESESWGCWSAGSKSCLVINNCHPIDKSIKVIIDAHAYRDAFRSCTIAFRTSSGHQGSLKIGKRRLYNVWLKMPIFFKNHRLVVGDFSKTKTFQNISTKKQPPVASIIIINHNKSHLTRLACIAVSSSSIRVSFEIICVDNASNSEDLSQLRGADDPLTLIELSENVGFSKACNRAAQEASGEFLLFLNNDAFLDKGAVDEMMSAFKIIPDCRIVGSVLRYPDGTMQEAGATLQSDGYPVRHGRNDPKFNPHKLPRFQPVDYVSGACLMIRKKDFLEMGGFGEIYSPAYYEDTDICMRALLYGQKVYLASRANCYHIENATSSTIEQSGWATQTAEAHREIFMNDWGAYLASSDPKDLPWHLRETKQMTTGGAD